MFCYKREENLQSASYGFLIFVLISGNKMFSQYFRSISNILHTTNV